MSFFSLSSAVKFPLSIGSRPTFAVENKHGQRLPLAESLSLEQAAQKERVIGAMTPMVARTPFSPVKINSCATPEDGRGIKTYLLVIILIIFLKGKK
jgi:hypothetical protein